MNRKDRRANASKNRKEHKAEIDKLANNLDMNTALAESENALHSLADVLLQIRGEADVTIQADLMILQTSMLAALAQEYVRAIARSAPAHLTQRIMTKVADMAKKFEPRFAEIVPEDAPKAEPIIVVPGPGGPS